ncbi:MAG: T9SS type A sorting domain-containing protein, partial [Bacteroidetes bacterium]|nr:T9SS type A sorting domain-containing protein [Bacteroidota bacterium]
CVADVYGGDSGPSTAAQGQEITISVPMARNTLGGACSGDPSFAIYLTGAGLDTYLLARRTVPLTEIPQHFSFTGTASNPAPPPGTYTVLLLDDVDGSYYVMETEVEITAASGVATEEETLPSEFGLASVWPNPFTSQASIAFSTDGAEPVSLRVYDVLGRERAVLMDARVLPSGAHAVTWNAAGLVSGTYVVRLESGSRTHTRLVTLQR